MNKFDISKFDDNTNYVIEASAGTGKTYNIVEIVKKLVNENNEDLNKILIVTYTEKAAGELKDRIRGAIKNKNIDVDNAPIYTIHSFCQNTIKEFGLSANLPLQLEVIDDYELKKFVKRYIREGEILEDFSYCYALRKNVTKSSAKSFDIGKVEEVLIQGVKKYYLNINNEEDSSIVSITNFNYNGFFQLIKDINEANSFEDLCSKNETIRKYYVTLANSNFQKSKEFANTLEDDITEIYLFNGSKFKTNYFNKASQEDQEAFKFFDEFKKNIEQNLQLCFAVKYIKDFYIKWQKYKEQNKSQNFDDMIRYVREAIINNENFKTILKQKYRRAIIDEFQDTNQKQFDIFKSIFLEDDNENGKHNIIVVGDPKQSIYSFQGADVNVYEKAVNEIVLNGGIKTQLSKNYRSTKNMVESCNDLFKYYNFDKTEFNNCEYLSKEKGDEDIHDVMYENNDVKAFWIAVDDDNREVDEYDFSEIVVQKIIDCCKKDENGKTKLQIRHKNKEFRNVSFKDFAVLTKTGSEVSPLEKALKNAGIPYLRYKDKKLFQGKECVDWICILNALTVIDYKGYNRNIMKKALFTNFFGHSLEILNSDYFNSDDRKDIYLLNEWKSLAYNKKWEDLIDSIIMDSKLESNLRTLKEIQTFAIYKQIGNYCIEFLTENNSLEKLVRMLTNLSDNGGSDSEEGEFIIEKSTNFDCVQIMTMHASKGLQFPIVIGLGGYKGPSNLSKAWTYHEINKQTQEENLILTFSNDNKIIEKEEIAEWKRLFYVAYTRAEFVLMLPYYKKFGLDKKNSKTKNDKTEEINFLRFSIESLIKNDKQAFQFIYKDKNISYNDLKKHSKQILNSNINNTQDDSKNNQDEILKKMIKCNFNKIVTKHSYSSLSHEKDNLNINDDNDYENKEGLIEEGLSQFDKNNKIIIPEYDNNINSIQLSANFPKGAKLGTVLHEIFEGLDFTNYSIDLDKKINYCFSKQGIKIDKKWLNDVYNIVENVLNAKLPVINGNKHLNDSFDLKSIAMENKLDEVEFNFNIKEEKLKNYCNGFVDMIFKRGDYYSIVDWKSDKLTDDFYSYSEINSMKLHVNDCYSIQRVLYSYCLIKWLKISMKDLSYQDIFEKHFGGIYYVFLRGCNENTGNGIYAQTWESWEELKKSYNQIMKTKIGGYHES